MARSATLALVATFALFLARPTAQTQDQTIKPTATQDRLPAPKPTARQLPDGRIEVSWPAVEGAAKYQVWRSVPPAPQALLSPDQTSTTYIDSDVKAGSTYYYATLD